MSLSALSSRLFPTMRSQAMARFAAPGSSFARFYATKKYTAEHEWVEIENGVATVGITNHAQEALGEIVYVEAAELKDVEKGDTIGSVESVKAASDIYAPISGTVIEVNAALGDEPGLLNTNPEDSAWLCKIQLSSEDEIKELLSEADYKQFCEESH
ncbi:glycine cleavage system H-protein subunit [Mortierella sp. GBA35]|nr:glycine cleavage system H-protein subunit [Mortierella sp. AD031]KAF9085022.1 glycine cleavage system H-protein subunit [Mortierella sp. GBA35]KAG0210103.1 glycine cleavage system H-protein subunit [Mortierella sp. NVP41]